MRVAFEPHLAGRAKPDQDSKRGREGSHPGGGKGRSEGLETGRVP